MCGEAWPIIWCVLGGLFFVGTVWGSVRWVRNAEALRDELYEIRVLIHRDEDNVRRANTQAALAADRSDRAARAAAASAEAAKAAPPTGDLRANIEPELKPPPKPPLKRFKRLDIDGGS